MVGSQPHAVAPQCAQTPRGHAAALLQSWPHRNHGEQSWQECPRPLHRHMSVAVPPQSQGAMLVEHLLAQAQPPPRQPRPF